MWVGLGGYNCSYHQPIGLVMFEVILEELESWNLPADVRIVLVFACLLILFYFRYFFGAGNSPVRTTVLLC